MKAGIILQARTGSQRLRGKVLAPIAGRTLAGQCLRRLAASGVAPVILATTTLAEDDRLAAAAADAGVPVFRGAAEDVLDRLARCASAFALDVVIRATADNPAVDVEAPVRLLDAMDRLGVDYVREDDLPYGAGVEGITAEALSLTALLARDAFDREHVTTFVRRRADLFRLTTLAVPATLARPDVRLTVDTPEELHQMRELYSLAGADMPSLASFIDAWDRLAQRTAA
jgi:spore coat polysaccharide biosynthesis protein SpsF